MFHLGKYTKNVPVIISIIIFGLGCWDYAQQLVDSVSERFCCDYIVSIIDTETLRISYRKIKEEIKM